MAGDGTLTTHVLDTTHGAPAAGVVIELFHLDGDDRRMAAQFVTNGDGRTDRPLLAGGDLERGRYELVFHVGAYFAARGVASDDPAFLDRVPVRFGVSDPGAKYHVPLLVSPYGYSTYRGS